MNNLTVINHKGQFTVDSREVAEMVDKRHDNLKRDIDGYFRILTSSEMSALDFFIPSIYTDEKGEGRPHYLITRKGCDMVANKMTGEKGVLFTATYVTKFEEMEKVIAKPQIPQSFAEALRLAADLEEEKQKLLPKAEQFDRFMSGENSQTMNDVAKCLKIGRNKLFAMLREKGILMNGNRPYQEYIDRGYFEVKEKPITMGDTSINYAQCYVTAKGVDYISKLVNKATA